MSCWRMEFFPHFFSNKWVLSFGGKWVNNSTFNMTSQFATRVIDTYYRMLKVLHENFPVFHVWCSYRWSRLWEQLILKMTQVSTIKIRTWIFILMAWIEILMETKSKIVSYHNHSFELAPDRPLELNLWCRSCKGPIPSWRFEIYGHGSRGFHLV